MGRVTFFIAFLHVQHVHGQQLCKQHEHPAPRLGTQSSAIEKGESPFLKFSFSQVFASFLKNIIFSFVGFQKGSLLRALSHETLDLYRFSLPPRHRALRSAAADRAGIVSIPNGRTVEDMAA